MTDYIPEHPYSKFLKQPLEKWMFVPCDEDGNILEYPEFHEPNNEDEIGDYDELIYEYQQAKERCLFKNILVNNTKLAIKSYKGIRVYNYNDSPYYRWFSEVFEKDGKPRYEKTIEDLLVYDLELTEAAIKQFES